MIKWLLNVIKRIFKVILCICLLPVAFCTTVFAVFVNVPVLLIIDIIRYIIAGKFTLVDNYLFETDTFENIGYIWCFKLVEKI